MNNKQIKDLGCIIDNCIKGGFSSCEISKYLYEKGYRKAEDVVKEFAEKLDLYLVRLFHKANDAQKECETHIGAIWAIGWQRNDERMKIIQSDIQPFIKKLAAEFGGEGK